MSSGTLLYSDISNAAVSGLGIIASPYNKQQLEYYDNGWWDASHHVGTRYLKGQSILPAENAYGGSSYDVYLSPTDNADSIYEGWDLTTYGPPSWYNPRFDDENGDEFQIEAYTLGEYITVGLSDLVVTQNYIELDYYDPGYGIPQVIDYAYAKNCYFQFNDELSFDKWTETLIGWYFEGCTFVYNKSVSYDYSDMVFWEEKNDNVQFNDCVFVGDNLSGALNYLQLDCAAGLIDSGLVNRFTFENCYFSDKIWFNANGSSYGNDALVELVSGLTKVYWDHAFNEVAISDDGQYIAAASWTNNKLWHSSDSGITWSSGVAVVTTGYHSFLGCKSIDMSADGKYQTAAEYSYSHSRLFVSNNYGITWSGKWIGGVYNSAGTYIGGSARIWNDIAMSSNGQYQSVVSEDSRAYVYRSSNYGVTWTSGKYAAAGIGLGIDMSADGKYQTIVEGTYSSDFKIYKSSNYGANWSLVKDVGSIFWQVNHNVCVTDDGEHQYAVCGDVLYSSADYGATWTTSIPVTGMYPANMDASSDGQYLIMAGSKGGFGNYFTNGWNNFYYSSDYGATWTTRTFPLGKIRAVAISATGENQVIVSSQVYISTDYGANWTLKLPVTAPYATFNNCHFQYDFGTGVFPSALTATIADKETFNFSNFNIPTETDPAVLARWVADDYNNGLFGEQRLGVGAFYFGGGAPPTPTGSIPAATDSRYKVVLSNKSARPYKSTGDTILSKIDIVTDKTLSYKKDIPIQLYLNWTGPWTRANNVVTGRYGSVTVATPTGSGSAGVTNCLGQAIATIDGKKYNSNPVRYNFYS